MTAAMIFHNGEILTLDAARPRVKALAIADGKILALGSVAEVMSTRGPETRVIDLRGKTLMPGLKDHHVHVLNVGFAILNQRRGQALFLDLSNARSANEIAQRVAERAAHLPAGTWIFGAGWNQIAWGTQKLPTHHVLSEAAPHHPVFLTRVDAHCAWANLAAMRAAGITGQTPNPPSGAIAHLDDGAPSGIFLERAAELLLKHAPAPSDGDVVQAFALGARTLAAQGLTEVYDAGFLAFPGIVSLDVPLEHYFDLLRKLDAREPLPLRVNLMIPAPSAMADAVTLSPGEFPSSPRLRITHIKLFADGAMGSRGAALTRPYADDPATQGVPRMTAEELKLEVERALAAGLDVATHAIGDAAITRVLDVYESVLAADRSIAPRRLRLEHFSIARATDIQRAAKLGIVLSIQPGFVYPGADGLTMEDSRMGAKNTTGAYVWARLARLKAVLAGGSDDFTTPPHALWNFYAAATRKNPAGLPRKGWHPAEKLSRKVSLRLFTDVCAPGGGPVSAGQLKPQSPADFVILSANPLTAAEKKILGIQVHATVFGGEFTHNDGTLK